MRLIDADALRKEWEKEAKSEAAELVRAFMEGVVAGVEAAPTVRCGECVSYRPWTASGSPDDSCCGNETLFGYMEDGCNPPASAGCSEFKRWERSGQEADDAAAEAWFGGEPR